MDPVEGFAEDGMVHFPRSDGWTDYKRTPNQAIFLAAGDNTLTLCTIGSSGANIDGIHLETMVSMDTATFPVFKFNLDPADDKSGLRGWSCCVQVGEVTLFDGSGTMLSGATATNPVGLEPLRPGGYCDNFGTAQNPGQNPCGELPSNGVDGNVDTLHGCINCDHKWLDFTRGDLIMKFAGEVTVHGFD